MKSWVSSFPPVCSDFNLLGHFFVFSKTIVLLSLRSIGYQSNIDEAYILSAVQRSTSWCSFGGNLYTFEICNISLHLEQLQCVNNKNNCQFLVGHICVGKFTFIKIGFQKKSKFSQLLIANLVYSFKRQYFFLRLAYNCSEVTILILFLVNILRPFFLI